MDYSPAGTNAPRRFANDELLHLAMGQEGDIYIERQGRAHVGKDPWEGNGLRAFAP